jgi:2-haloacid dehalogenase
MDAYLTLAPLPDVREALARLRDRRCAILSDGAPRMLEAVVANGGLGGCLRVVVSVDEVRTLKPHPAVYALGLRGSGSPGTRSASWSSNG